MNASGDPSSDDVRSVSTLLARSTTVAKNTILLGALLIILGVGTFALLGFDGAKLTALLPAAFGGVFVGLGVLARRQGSWRRPLLTTAGALALIVVLGTLPGVIEALRVLLGAPVARPAAAFEQAFVSVLCLGYVGRAAKAVLDARRPTISSSI